MIRAISILLVLVIATAIAQWDRPNPDNSDFSIWGNGQGNNLNQNNGLPENNQQGSSSWNNEQEEFNRPWNGQNRPGTNQNRPGNNQNRPWNRPTSTTTRSTTRRRQTSTTQRSTTSTTQRSTTSNPTSSTSSDFSTTASPAFTSCMSLCRTTPEYNPVCGSDSRTYNNEQRLNCAVNCGLNINLAFRGACDPA